MSVEKVYSNNDQDWFEELQDAIDAAIDRDVHQECIYIMEGEKDMLTHSRLSSSIGDSVIQQIQEWAYDECGDYSDQYLEDLGEDKISELSKVISEWIEKNAEAPAFYKVVNIKNLQCSDDIALSFEG
jgi:hypothetical protein